eukprot:m.1639599 g.1639599  ORF g.1639599 m.1639599 type:complete len:403 (-) comp36777_c0_seq1:339-1547(-)
MCMQKPSDRIFDELLDLEDQDLTPQDAREYGSVERATDHCSVGQMRSTLDGLDSFAADDPDAAARKTQRCWNKIQPSGRLQSRPPRSSLWTSRPPPRLPSGDLSGPELDKTLSDASNAKLDESFLDLDALYYPLNDFDEGNWEGTFSSRLTENAEGSKSLANCTGTLDLDDTESPASSLDVMSAGSDDLPCATAAATHSVSNVVASSSASSSTSRSRSVGVSAGKRKSPSPNRKCTKAPQCKKPTVGGTKRQDRVRASVRVTPSRRRKKAEYLNHISDEDLAGLEIPQLMRLGKIANFSEDRMKDLKVRRRKLRNRCSARGSAQKRRTEFKSVVSSRHELEDEYKRLQEEHRALIRTHDMLMTQAETVKQITRYEALSIQDLTTRVQELQAAAGIYSEDSVL